MQKKLHSFIHTIFYRNLPIMIIAVIIDAIWGDPKRLYQRITHPIVWIGKLIEHLDLRLNHPLASSSIQKRKGFYALALTIALPSTIGLLIQHILFRYFPKPIATLFSALIASIFIAGRSLSEHVQAVQIELEKNNMETARIAVGHIVGRKTATLDESGVSRAAIESLAENFSDGVTAPIFWGCIGGLPGIIAYKAINTADSMIGHTTKRHKYFGYASAKLDDYINLPASRLSALWITLATKKHPISFMKSVASEAKKHNSPNAGWPEAAMALCMNIQLAGPRQYQETLMNTPWIGQGRSGLNHKDIKSALSIFQKSYKIFWIILLISFLFNRFLLNNNTLFFPNFKKNDCQSI